MKKILLPGLAAGLVMLVVAMVFGMLLNMVFPSLAAEYETPNLFRPWSDPIMMLYFLHPFILGVLLAWAWDKVKTVLQEPLFWKRGAMFGIGFWAISSIPGMFMTYSSFYLSLGLVFSWLISGLLQAVFAGIVYAKMNK